MKGVVRKMMSIGLYEREREEEREVGVGKGRRWLGFMHRRDRKGGERGR